MKEKRLNDVFTPDAGIFSYLDAYAVPWQAEDISDLLNSEYHYNIAGARIISPLVKNMLASDETLSAEARGKIAHVCFSLYGLKWSKLWQTMQFEYNPIENYDMTENLTGDREQTTYGKTDSFTHGHSETLTHATTETLTHNTGETVTHNTTDTRTPLLNTETENTVQGFNSSTYQPDTKTETSETGSETTTRTGTDSTAVTGTDSTQKTGTETTAHTGTDTSTAGGNDVKTHEYTLTRHGNIGVTTSQQMIESERNLWNWQFFYDVVFPDVNRVLTLSVY